MKTRTLVAMSFCLLGLPLAAQEEIIVVGGSTNNGDFETGMITPFQPILDMDGMPVGMEASTDVNHTEGGQYSYKLDLTSNNANGKWKGLTSPPEQPDGFVAEVVKGDTIITRFWVYIPAETNPVAGPPTTFGPAAAQEASQPDGGFYSSLTDPPLAASLRFSLEWRNANSPTNPDQWLTVPGTFQQVPLPTATREEWFLVSYSFPAPDEATHVRSRSWNLRTLDVANGKRTAFGPQPPFASLELATPADWAAEGYSGAIYLDDFEYLVGKPAIGPVFIGPGINNGDIEDSQLIPWGANGGSIATAPEPVRTGNQSLAIDLTANNGNGQWKGIGGINAPVQNGDSVRYSAWIYVPATTTSGGELSFFANLRSNRVNDRNAGNDLGVFGGFPNFNLNNETNFPRDTWTQVTVGPTLATDSFRQISSLNTNAWNITTVREINGKVAFGAGPDVATPQDWIDGGYEGKIYFDDFELVVDKRVEPGDTGVTDVVSADFNNGDFEETDEGPWGGNAVSYSTAQANSGTQSLEVSLTANNDQGDSKLIINKGLTTLTTSSTDTVTVTGSIYVPSSATFGTMGLENATLFWDIVDQNGDQLGFGEVDLTGLTPNTWETFDVPDIELTPNSRILIFNEFSLETSTPLPAVDGEPLTEQDWMNAGYTGSFFIDDIAITVTPGEPDPTPVITGITRNKDDSLEFTYTPDDLDVDVYFSEDLQAFNPVKLGSGETGGFFSDLDGAETNDPDNPQTIIEKRFYVIQPALTPPPGSDDQ